MTTKAPGESIVPQITITDTDDEAYEPSSLTLNIYDSSGTLQESVAKASMENPSTGVYYYVYDLASDAAVGDWRYDWVGGSDDTVIESEYFTVETPVTTSLATIQDVYREANVTSSDISSVDIAEMIVECEDILKLRTNRSTFTGSAAKLAKKAVVAMVVDRLVTSRPDKLKSAIASISENGAKIDFVGGKIPAKYQADAERCIKALRIPGTPHTGMYNFADTGDTEELY